MKLFFQLLNSNNYKELKKLPRVQREDSTELSPYKERQKSNLKVSSKTAVAKHV